MVDMMGHECFDDADMEILPSMWPEDVGDEARKQFNIEKPGMDRDMLEDVTIEEDPSLVDFKRLVELTNYSEKGSSQLAYLVKNWEYKQTNAVRLLNEELNNLNKQKQEAELKKLEILEEYRFEEEKHVGDKRPISILDDVFDIWETVPRRRNDVFSYNKNIEIDAEFDSIKYWKQRAIHLDKMLEASIQREQALIENLQENIKNLETQSSPVEELSQILKRADNFLHFILQNAPVVIGHQDNELRYRFIYNHFPRLDEEDIIGKTDTEIFSGAGVKEIQEFKKEVLERGLPAKREITFETPLFGSKTFLIYVEPVFSKTGETIGINYMGMDVTDQVAKSEKMAKLREEIAVQKAKETELNKTIHITEETMRAKQMLATMSHEIRSPLTGVVGMAEILANTRLDKEQRQLLEVMLSSGDLVLQLINDILDLSKVESGVMKLEAAKFRPREVVKHVLQTAAASLQKELTLEGNIDDNVPVEVIGDVLRIRQILTNLISNAVKFTHEGKVGVNLQVVSERYSGDEGCNGQLVSERSPLLSTRTSEERAGSCLTSAEDLDPYGTPVEKQLLTDEDAENNQPYEKIVFLRCDVYDTGIGIPEKALPSLFKKYMQVSTDHARKYGGTGLGLAICKQLVELMGGKMTLTSQVNCGSTFTFFLPCKVPSKPDYSDDPDEVSTVSEYEITADVNTEENNGSYVFKPRTLGTLFASGEPLVRKPELFGTNMFTALSTPNGLSEKPDLLSSNGFIRKESSVESGCSVPNNTEKIPALERSQYKPEHHPYDVNIANRRDEADLTSPQSIISAEYLLKGCREVINEAKSSDYRLPCQMQSDMNFQRTDDGISELSKVNSNPKILLVEDNKINVMVARSMMKQLGHTIDVVGNGLEAIHAVQQSHYDLILMDVCMPIMDGLQATRLIRSFEEHGCWDESIGAGVDQALPSSDSPPSASDSGQCRKRIAIIAMTANALSESADDCIANGMDSFLSKPVTFQKLKQCLQQYLPR